MKDKDNNLIVEPIPLERALEEAYKAGYDEGVDAEGWCDGFDKGKQKGIREVVEWIRKANHSGDFYYSFDQADLQAKLKEWGI